MTTATVRIKINGMNHDLKVAEMISYEELCKLAVQPPEYNPTVMWTPTPETSKYLLLNPGEEVPLTEGSAFSVMIDGRR